MSAAPSEFRATLAAARQGGSGAWRRLYDDHAPSVLGYLRSQRAPSPEDLLGEVWLQAVRDLRRFDGDEAGFRAWLLTIAHHRLLDARRAISRRPVEVGGDDILESAGGLEPAASAQLESEEELLRLLDGMPERQRSVLYLRFVLELPQREVASILGVSTPAMKMLQMRATRALERRVAELHAAGDDTLPLPSTLARRSGE